jgi:peptidoglycan/xylan/chitin deacetylase (PgdA/CDA1 family)
LLSLVECRTIVSQANAAVRYDRRAMPAAATEVVLTFDNLGEAADEERGLPTGPAPHPSIAVAVPRLLELLQRHDLRATFFVEAVNAERYPDTLDAIRDGGHELGCHGWRHELFGQLPPSERPAILDRSLAALRGTGVAVDGFRPPGGIITGYDLALLAGRGIRWCSPAGSAPGIDRNVVCLPFAWPLIDAYYRSTALAPLRTADGLPEEPLSVERYLKAIGSELDRVSGPDAPALVCLIMHPYLYAGERGPEVLDGLLERLARLQESGIASVGPGTDAAQRLRTGDTLGAPALAAASWA